MAQFSLCVRLRLPSKAGTLISAAGANRRKLARRTTSTNLLLVSGQSSVPFVLEVRSGR